MSHFPYVNQSKQKIYPAAHMLLTDQSKYEIIMSFRLRGGKIKFLTFVFRGTFSPYTVSVNAKLLPLTRGSGVLILVLVRKLTFG